MTSIFRRGLLLVVFVSPLVACGQAVLTRTLETQAPREPHCDFQVLTAWAPGYMEIGTVDVRRGNAHTVAELKAAIQPKVCEAGGDAVLPSANAYGRYVEATVLKAMPARSVVVSAASAAPAAVSGCQYDTQCKGDRVCQRGECVDPAKKL